MTEMLGTVLVVDDDEMLLGALAQWLTLSGFKTLTAANADAGVTLLKAHPVDAVLTDVRMPGRSGMDLLRTLRDSSPDLPVVLLTGHGDVPLAVEALKLGAFDFLTKPHDPERLIATLRNACTQHVLTRRLHAAEARLGGQDAVSTCILGQSAAMLKLKDEVRALLDAPLDILIRGETGTGKEVVARALHDCGPRRTKPFVAINCAAVPHEIFESELFGHEAGAFTGAKTQRVGKFEFATGGTVFLDEIESMPLGAQAKVLRVLQERVIERVGSNRLIPIDVRVVSAAKLKLREAAGEGSFREDLYYRLAGYEIDIPPLRQRGDDVILLFTQFATACAERANRRPPELTPALVATLLNHPWPGNVRELKSAAERFGLGLGLHLCGCATPAVAEMRSLDSMLDDYERSLILAALNQSEGSIAGAMQILDVPRRTLNEKMRRLGIERAAARAHPPGEA